MQVHITAYREQRKPQKLYLRALAFLRYRPSNERILGEALIAGPDGRKLDDTHKLDFPNVAHLITKLTPLIRKEVRPGDVTLDYRFDFNLPKPPTPSEPKTEPEPKNPPNSTTFIDKASGLKVKWSVLSRRQRKKIFQSVFSATEKSPGGEIKEK